MSFNIGDRVLVRGDCDTRMEESRWRHGSILRLPVPSRHRELLYLTLLDSHTLSHDPHSYPRATPRVEWWCSEEHMELLVPLSVEEMAAMRIQAIVNRKPPKRYGPFKPIAKALP